MEQEERNARLKELIEDAKKEIYVLPYKPTDAEALGVMVAQFHRWDPNPIIESIQNALEDANLHSLNAQFTDLVSR